jgi:tetratricopeptide (TPR) repeat protein
MNSKLRLMGVAAVGLSIVVGGGVWWQGKQARAAQLFDRALKAAQVGARAGAAGAESCKAALPPLETALAGGVDGGREEVVARAVGECSMLLQRHPQAAEAFRKVTVLQPQQARAHADLARALSRAGQHAEAKRSAQLAVQLAPDAWQSYRTHAMILSAAGDTQGAVDAFTKARSLAPPNEHAAADQVIAQLRAKLPGGAGSAPAAPSTVADR